MCACAPCTRAHKQGTNRRQWQSYSAPAPRSGSSAGVRYRAREHAVKGPRLIQHAHREVYGRADGLLLQDVLRPVFIGALDSSML